MVTVLGDRLLEALADFRPDLAVQAEIEAMVGNAGLDEHYPTIRAGVLPRSWLKPGRAGARHLLDGEYVDVRPVDTVAHLAEPVRRARCRHWLA